MPNPPQPLPDDVLQALRRGTVLDAIKLLTRSGFNLQEAKRLVDAELHQSRPRGQAPHVPPHAGSSHAPHAPTYPVPSALRNLHSPWPPAIAEALRHGHKIEAIRLLREHTGLGLKEAKEAIEAHAQTMLPTVDGLSPRNGLSPGEVPRSSGLGWWLLIAMVIGAGVAWHFMRRSAG